LTDDGPVYHALSVHLSRAMLITRFDDRYAVAKFSKYRVWYRNFLIIQCRIGGKKLPCQNQRDSFSRLHRTLTCDRQTDRQTDTWLQTKKQNTYMLISNDKQSGQSVESVLSAVSASERRRK